MEEQGLQDRLEQSQKEARLFEQLLKEAGLRMVPAVQCTHEERVFQIAVATLEARAIKSGDATERAQLTRVMHVLRRQRIIDMPTLREFHSSLANGHRRRDVGPKTIEIVQELLAVSEGT